MRFTTEFFKNFPFFQCSFPPKNRTITLSFELNEQLSVSSRDFFLTVNLDGLIKSILVQMFLPIKSCAGANEVVVWGVDQYDIKKLFIFSSIGFLLCFAALSACFIV